MKSVLLVVGGVVVGGITGFAIRGGNEVESIPQAELAAMRSSSPGAATSVSESVTTGQTEFQSLREIYNEPSQTARVQALLDFYSNLSPDRYESEADKLENLPFSERILASYLLFSQWAETDAEGALAYSDKMGRAGFFVKPTILQGWAGSNPEVAAQYLADNPREFAMMDMMGGRRGGNGAASTIAKEWARTDPEAAMAWAKGLDGRSSREAIANIIQEVSTKDPIAGIAMAETLQGEEKTLALQKIAGEWGREDWTAMKAWAGTLPSEQRDAALREALPGYALQDPQGAAREVLAMDTGDARDSGIQTVAENWARNDPEAAMDFLLANGSEQAQEDGMRDVMSSLARTDPAAGLARIGTLGDGDVRDRAVSTYVFSAQEGSPEELINLAATIGDDRRRERSVSMATTQWLREDATAANQFLENTDLMTPETVESIRERAENGGRRGRRGR